MANRNVHGQYLVRLRVKYEPDATDVQRSLGWLTPELIDADLTLTEDGNVREWSSVVDNDTYARLADAWGLDGQLGSRMFDGLRWPGVGVGRIQPNRLGPPQVSEREPIEPRPDASVIKCVR